MLQITAAMANSRCQRTSSSSTNSSADGKTPPLLPIEPVHATELQLPAHVTLPSRSPQNMPPFPASAAMKVEHNSWTHLSAVLIALHKKLVREVKLLHGTKASPSRLPARALARLLLEILNLQMLRACAPTVTGLLRSISQAGLQAFCFLHHSGLWDTLDSRHL